MKSTTQSHKKFKTFKSSVEIIDFLSDNIEQTCFLPEFLSFRYNYQEELIYAIIHIR